MIRKSTRVLLAVCCLALPAGLLAESRSAYPQPESVTGNRPLTRSEKMPEARFTSAGERQDHRLDWAHLDEALGWMVIPMGPSLRQGASRVDPGIGTRRIYGHESRLRLEGNRLAFSFLTPNIIAALGEYRADLEEIGSTLDIASLPRNEQLAYWLNLHNVAVIEALAQAYPLGSTQGRSFGPNGATLDDAKLVKVAGIALSPRDIRERIVYPNWRDPKVIYGFWRGEIGGPSIQRIAYTGGNVDQLLALSGEEFVNSLRGVEAWGGALRVSLIYREAAPFYFKGDEALRTHLTKFAGDDVAALLRKHVRIGYNLYESDIADLERGETDPNFLPRAIVDCKAGGCFGGVALVGGPPSIKVNPAITRLMRERAEKLDRAREKGIRLGTVIVGDGESAEGATPREVE
jgi:Protein of unknown function, DUF547